MGEDRGTLIIRGKWGEHSYRFDLSKLTLEECGDLAIEAICAQAENLGVHPKEILMSLAATMPSNWNPTERGEDEPHAV